MNGPRQRLAWAFLLVGFFVCVSLTIAVPLGVRTVVQQASRSLTVNVQANQGTVGILQGDNESGALFAGEPAQDLDPNGSVLTNATDSALLLVYTPDELQLLARVQVYGNTNVSLDRASTPRFDASSAVHELALTLNGGRLHLTVPQESDRPLAVKLSVPQGEISVREAGRYSVITSNAETQIAVLQGSVEAETGNESLTLSTDERGILPADGQPDGPLGSERNLVKNGDFSRGLEEWVLLEPNIEIAGQPTVETAVNGTAAEPLLRMSRVGIGHADVSLRQIVNQDVTDFKSLRLVVSMRVANQSLGVCGQRGSECPLIIRIEYVDVNGVDQTWQQGFYAFGDTGPDTPDVCVACPPPLNEHQRIPYQQLLFYESENLLEKLGQLEILPRQIKSITLTASGHTFDTEIVDVSLLAEE